MLATQEGRKTPPYSFLANTFFLGERGPQWDCSLRIQVGINPSTSVGILLGLIVAYWTLLVKTTYSPRLIATVVLAFSANGLR